MQWHPFFAHVLRPLLQEYYDVQTDVPVGDLPREADIVLVRRTAPAPFVGIWHHLTLWNILEFKGPTDTPALRDLDLLLEVGLGIDRRLNDEQRRQGQAIVERNEVSRWYLANHVGARFRAEAEQLLGGLAEHGPGLWRACAFGRPLWIVSRDALPVERESVPLHLVTLEPAEQSRALVAAMVRQPDLWHTYGVALLKLHGSALQEVLQMEPSLLEHEPFTGDLRPLIAVMGLQRIIDQAGPEKVFDLSLKKLVETQGTERISEFLKQLTPEQQQQLKDSLP